MAAIEKENVWVLAVHDDADHINTIIYLRYSASSGGRVPEKYASSRSQRVGCIGSIYNELHSTTDMLCWYVLLHVMVFGQIDLGGCNCVRP